MGINKTTQALIFANVKHEGQKRKKLNIPYVLHPIQVFNLLRMVTDDENILVAALLHDTLEDTNTTYEELKETFGETIADIVQEVTNDNDGNPHIKTKEGLMVKLADVLHNISDNSDPKYLEKKIKWLQELEI